MKHQFDARHVALLAVLREARARAALSQRDVSVRLGRSETHFGKLEQGERTLSYLEAIDVAEALGLDPFDLLDRVLSYGKPAIKLDPVVVTAKPRKKK